VWLNAQLWTIRVCVCVYIIRYYIIIGASSSRPRIRVLNIIQKRLRWGPFTSRPEGIIGRNVRYTHTRVPREGETETERESVLRLLLLLPTITTRFPSVIPLALGPGNLFKTMRARGGVSASPVRIAWSRRRRSLIDSLPSPPSLIIFVSRVLVRPALARPRTVVHDCSGNDNGSGTRLIESYGPDRAVPPCLRARLRPTVAKTGGGGDGGGGLYIFCGGRYRDNEA